MAVSEAVISIGPAQLGSWFDAHASRLVLYARQWVPAATAEDLVQDIFLRLAAQPRAPDNVHAWLLTSTRHAALDALKTSRRRGPRDAAAGEARAFERQPADTLNPAEVEAMLAQLSPLQREVITLKIWNDATFQEIAAITSTPLSTVYAHYKSGLTQLKRRLETPCRKT